MRQIPLELSDFLEIKLRRNLRQASLLKRHRLTQWMIYGLIKERTAVQMHASTTESFQRRRHIINVAQ